MYQFLKNSNATALTEGLIVLPVMTLAIAVVIEFTYGMYQWNQAEKALQLGARKAAISCPITNDFDSVFAFDPAKGGQLIDPNSAIVSTCGPGAEACNAARLNRLVCGPDQNCSQTEAGTTWQGMVVFFDRIRPENVLVTYEKTGLGYEGRPAGPVVTVRLELRNVNFNLPVLGKILRLGNIVVPGFPVTVTSEDLRSGKNSC